MGANHAGISAVSETDDRNGELRVAANQSNALGQNLIFS
jgi:hypothetical protein